jgi:signal transduction histidine kinase
MSLLVNATQAIDGDGEVRIETSRNADHAVIRITDDGRGIPEEQLGRIFDPGFTTRGVGVGTGLGLAICYRIIENHRGTLSVVSEVGKGSTFTIEIPLRAEAPQPSQTKVAHSH